MLVNIQGSRVCCRILTGGQQAPRALDNYNKHTLYQTLERFWETIKWNGKFLYATFLEAIILAVRSVRSLHGVDQLGSEASRVLGPGTGEHSLASATESGLGTKSPGTDSGPKASRVLGPGTGEHSFSLGHRVRYGNLVPRH